MPKVRTLEELSDQLSKDFAWRIKEISDIHGQISKSQGSIQSSLLRVGITILYAHWEGFIKYASEAYLIYISHLTARNIIEFNKLQPNFKALALWDKFRKTFNTGGKIDRPETYITSLSPYLSNQEATLRTPSDNVINTDANLTFRVLQGILCIVNLEEQNFQSKNKFIDAKLLDLRNRIVHGERCPIDLTEYQEVHKTTLELLNLFRNLIENAAVLKAYSIIDEELVS